MILNEIRVSEKVRFKRDILNIIGCLMLGITLGVISEAFDEIPSNTLPQLLKYLDLANFFSKMGIWMFIAFCISRYAKSAIRAIIYTLVFFIGMLSAYFIFVNLVADFNPGSYMYIWIGITAISPILALGCFYSRGEHCICIILSSSIFAVMSLVAFNLGTDFSYFDTSGILELIIWIVTLIILYINPKQFSNVLILGCLLFILLSFSPLVYFII